MARPLRLELAGGLYHVTSRGDRREVIFVDDADRFIWLDLFGKTCSRFNWICHAWCLMENHYHIVVETIDANLSRGMRHLNGVYTQATNRRHDRVGHLFQGRYQGILVDKHSYLLELTRYVVLNPVRAGMVRDCADWRWSSYRAMISAAPAEAWLQTDTLLAQFSKNRKAAIKCYVDFVRAGVGLPSLWEKLCNQIYLGSPDFVIDVQGQTDKLDIDEIPLAQRRPPALTLAEYQTVSSNSSEAMTRAYLSGAYSMREIAKYFDVHYASVSRAVKKLESGLA